MSLMTMPTMNAIVMQDGEVSLQQVDLPKPQAGQVLVRSLACGICGSDIHITRHYNEVFDFYRQLGVMPEGVDKHAAVMLGHEFCAEIVEFGPQTQQALALGTRVTSVPILMSQNGAGVGVTPGVNGAYSEYFILDEALLMPVPEHLPSEAVALTEPLAVGLHAVNRGDVQAEDVALVVGCGPIGLAVISALHLRGVAKIVAADLQSDKLQLAREFGATHTVNPSEQDEVAFAAKLAAGQRLVIFECVGIHKLIEGFVQRAPAKATIVVTGIHTANSNINYAYATVKELDMCFSYYYQPAEFAACLEELAQGTIPWRKLLTGKVGMDGVSGAFKQLMKPNPHIKVVIEPWRNGELEMLD
ncbi:Alcohol dehydrogenase, zinc-binding domain protein [Shewanella sp. MR-4]|uniref:zinc-binding dehydrogenase n=1 Tax=Shewanella sp. (strain MR-4) TaxID=60480 RepID=UPI00005E53ED|nr:zinc-binding dehydrogenase [Shewanella sp. MR-4]ABI37390.1 Alcohol dehydrogenase, zinc-binding domain protein [Shewanella sp. MR-4]